MLAADISNYSSDLTPAALAAWKDAGIGLVIVQAIDPPSGYPRGKTREQIEACLAAGLKVDAYIWLWFDLDISDVVHKLGLLVGLDVHQIFLDVEDTAAIKYDQATCEAKVAAALEQCDSIGIQEHTGLYTGRWYWADRRYMGNTTAFSDRELWDANYDDLADANVGFAPYGGWRSAQIKQYRGTTSLGGVSGLDLNVLSAAEEAELTGGNMPEEPENPCAGLINGLAYVADNVVSDWLTAEIQRKTRSGAQAAISRTLVKQVIAESQRIRVQQIGERP